MSHGSLPEIYRLNQVAYCHTCAAESLIICRICTHGFCREHFVMCTTCHEWLCVDCFDQVERHKCRAMGRVVEFTGRKEVATNR